MLFFLPGALSRGATSEPKPGDVTVGVEGRTLTPKEQEELQQEFKDGAFGGKDGQRVPANRPAPPGR